MFETLKKRFGEWMNPQERKQATELYQRIFLDAAMPSREELAELCGIDLADRPAQVALIRFFDEPENQEQRRHVMKTCLLIADPEEVLALDDGHDQVAILLFRDSLWEDQESDILEDIRKDMLNAWPHASFCMTIGNLDEAGTTAVACWRSSWRAAVGLQDYRYVKANGKLISYQDITERRKQYPKGVQFRFDLLRRHLTDVNSDGLNNWLEGCFSLISGADAKAFGMRYHLSLEIVINAISLLREHGISPEQRLEDPMVLIGNILEPVGAEEQLEWLKSLLDRVRKLLREESGGFEER